MTKSPGSLPVAYINAAPGLPAVKKGVSRPRHIFHKGVNRQSARSRRKIVLTWKIGLRERRAASSKVSSLLTTATRSSADAPSMPIRFNAAGGSIKSFWQSTRSRADLFRSSSIGWRSFLGHAGVQERVHQLFQSWVDRIEASDGRAAGERLYDLREVFRFDAGIPSFLRVDNDLGSLLAPAEAVVGFYFDIDSARSQPLRKFIHDLHGTAVFAVEDLTDKASWFH